MRMVAQVGARRALVDTSGYYALTDPRDSNHRAAVAINTRLTDEHWRLYTTNLILAETHALVLRRMGRATAWRVLTELDQSRATTIVRVSVADEARARGILAQYTDKQYSLTDATSFVVMERLGLTQAFTFDHNFTQHGLVVLQGTRP